MKNILVITPAGHVYQLLSPDGDVYPILKETVGGWLEAVSLPDGTMYVDEEGKLKGVEPNPIATMFARMSKALRDDDYIAGPVCIMGPPDESGDDKTVPPALIERLHRMLATPLDETVDPSKTDAPC